MKQNLFEKKRIGQRKAYKIQEEDEPDWMWDLKTEKKSLRRTMPAASDDEITIQAASKIAKQYHTTRSKILSQLTPSNNIKGSRTWDKDGKVFKESIKRVRKSLNEAITPIYSVWTDDIGSTPDGRLGLITQIDIEKNTVYAEMNDTQEVETFEYGKEFYVKSPDRYTLTVTLETEDEYDMVKSDIMDALQDISSITIFDYNLDS